MFDKIFKKRRIYLDYASLTPIDPRVISEMKKYSSNKYANPSSFYKEGIRAKDAIIEARTTVANFFHGNPNELIFTSGGTESNNIAILGVVESLREKGVGYEDMHIMVSAIEHSSVRECVNYLSNKGVKIDVLGVEPSGVISLEELKKKINKNTVLVSVMTVNNEIGVVEPIREISKIIRKARAQFANSGSAFNFQEYQYPIFHTDASQAGLFLDLNVHELGTDLITIDSSKLYGPRGVGALFIKKDTPIRKIFAGGSQELDMRPGTENLPVIMGFKKAIELVNIQKETESSRVYSLKKYFLEKLKATRSDLKVNGGIEWSDSRDMHNREQTIYSPYILNVSFPKIDNELFVLRMDAKGVCCSTKSSCLNDSDESYVLKSIGSESKESIRFSFGRWTTKKEVDRAVVVVKRCLEV